MEDQWQDVILWGTGKLVAVSSLLSIIGTPLTRRRVVLLPTALFLLSTVPAHAWYGYWRPHVFIAPRMVVPVVPFWAPYAYPPALVAPAPVYVPRSPPIIAQPSAPTSYWYYCDNPQGYYPYIQQCPGGWKQVVPTPQ